VKGRKVFFFEKKKQKAFFYSHLQLGRVFAADPCQVAKVFWFFFQKRTSSKTLYKKEKHP